MIFPLLPDLGGSTELSIGGGAEEFVATVLLKKAIVVIGIGICQQGLLTLALRRVGQCLLSRKVAHGE